MRSTKSGCHNAAGQTVAQEVVEPIGAEPRERLLEQRIDRIVVEVARSIAQAARAPGEVGAVQHQGLELLVMILLLRREDEIDRVRERRMRDVVQQARDLFARRGASAAAAGRRRPGCARIASRP